MIKTLQQINQLVKEIQSEFGKGCLILRHENLSPEQRCALWSFTDIFLQTSLREGLSLMPMEFVAIK